MRLNATASLASEKGFDCFTSVLTTSPHKNAGLIWALGGETAKRVGREFLQMDFKHGNGFQKSVEASRALGLYRQTYCGCKFSLSAESHREERRRPASSPTFERAEQAAKAVTDAALKVHSTLGPGLLESVYEACVCHELKKSGIPFKSHVALPVVYDGVKVEAGLRLPLVVDDCLVVDLKSAEKLTPLFEMQMHTCLKLTGLRLGLIVNFNVASLREGMRRIAL